MSGDVFELDLGEVAEEKGASYVRVVPEVSLDKSFDYAVPEEWRGKVMLGSKVLVPFGSRELVGYVVDLMTVSEVKRVKPIVSVLGGHAVISPHLIRLAKWMAEYYCGPLSLAFRAIMPEAIRHAESGYKERLWVEARAGLTTAEVLPELGRAHAQKKAWEFLAKQGAGWFSEWVAASGVSEGAWHGLADRNFITIAPAQQERDPFADKVAAPFAALALNEEQRVALEAIEAECVSEKPRVVLLHGVTGSGKTEVYLQAIERTLARGKNALVLVPEIALTPQTVERFRGRFQGQKAGVAVLHSHLSRGERHDQWQRVRSGRARIVIGARSAVFAPVDHLGIIVVDEEHEGSYKQEETPHYHARDVAVMRGHLEKTVVVLGSATPSLESFLHAREGKYVLCSLTKRVEVQAMPTMHVIDLRQEFKKTKKARLISVRLEQAINERLAAKQQSIIFLNRRGYSTSLQCPQCGQVENCPHCSLPLTFHRAVQKLCCHLCDFTGKVPLACPECGFANYKHSGSGTEKIEELLSQHFPMAQVARMDSDSMRGKDAYERTLKAFADGAIDLLVGTQMIAKGLHFPNVTCIGVINADMALHIPDFRASERVFQVLMQVAGRSGRGDVPGEVFVQTSTPFHPAIQFARHHDYDGFVQQELEFRQALDYPPFRRAILITWRGPDDANTLFVAEKSAEQVRKALASEEVEIGGPGPAPILKIRDEFRYHLLIRAKRIPPVSRKLRGLFVDAKWPEGIKASVDVDAMSLM